MKHAIQGPEFRDHVAAMLGIPSPEMEHLAGMKIATAAGVAHTVDEYGDVLGLVQVKGDHFRVAHDAILTQNSSNVVLSS